MKISKNTAYRILQLTGWLFFVLIIAFVNYLQGNPITQTVALNLVVLYILGITITHLLRLVIIKSHWLERSFWKHIPLILLTTIAFGVVFHLLQYTISDVIIDNKTWQFNWSEIVLRIINWTLLLLLWEAIYIVYHFVENYRKEEIKNLKWQAAKNEMELNKLKSQLNPHFLFNAMNTIRALIDENPSQAKQAVTNLSHILRSSLQFGKMQLIPLEQELKIVNDYLSIEKMRFEEKLDFSIEIDENIIISNYQIPPMMLQTLVENAIKHGTAKLPQGGKITIKITPTANDKIKITITNPGEYFPSEDNKNGTSGFGIANTRQRLQLIFDESAEFFINSNQNLVNVTLIIPKHTKK